MRSHQQSVASLDRPARGRRAAHDLALGTLGLAIVRGDYGPGSLLPSKEELMADLDVSRTTIREALQTLAAKGMIAARTKVGTKVLDESHWNMFDAELLAWRLEIGIPPAILGMLMEIRQSLEPLAAALAATRRSARDIQQLRALTRRMKAELRHSSAFVDADVAFHRHILEASGNAFMFSLAALISTALSASFLLSAPDRDAALARRVFRQHEEIVDAIEAGDPDRASEAMMAVIVQGWLNVGGTVPQRLAALDLLRFAMPVVKQRVDRSRIRKAAAGVPPDRIRAKRR